MADKPGSFRDGRAAFKIPSRETPCETYYKIYGDLDSGVPPLIMLHGGPGSGHEYLEPFSGLWEQYGIPVVFYDQIGGASSTHLPGTVDDKELWQPGLFVAQLDSLLEHLGISSSERGYDVLGHSWGGTVAIHFATRQPRGLRRLILGGANASPDLFKKNIFKLIERLPSQNYHAVLAAVKADDFTGEEYREAMGAADSTVRQALMGRSPFVYDGTMGKSSNIPLLPSINVPTLVYNGEHDTAQYPSTVPFFDHIPRVRWITIPGASHMSHLDSPEMLQQTLKMVGHFLRPEKEFDEWVPSAK